MKRNLACALAFGIPATVFLMTAAAWGMKRHSLLRDGVHVLGTVVKVELRTSTSRDRDGNEEEHSMYYPVIEFTASGDAAEAESVRRPSFRFEGMGSNPPAFTEGDRVEVVYARDDPRDALIDSFAQLWFGPILLSGFGLAFAIGAIWSFIALQQGEPAITPPR